MQNNGRPEPRAFGLSTPIRPGPIDQNISLPGSIRTNRGRTLAGSISSGLKALSPTLQLVEEKAQEAANQQVILDSVKSPAELRKMIADGKIPGGTRKAYDAVIGRKVADDFQFSLAKSLAEEFNPNSGDIKSFVNGKRQSILDGLGSDAERIAFIKHSDKITASAITNQRKFQIESIQRDAGQGVLAGFRDIADTAAKAGKSPAEIADALAGEASASKQLLRLSPDQADSLWFQFAAEAAAKGNTDLVNAIIKHKRGGRGALTESGKFALKSYNLIDSSRSQDVQNFKWSNVEAQSVAERLVDAGEFDPEAFSAHYPDVPKGVLTNYRLRSEDRGRRIKAAALKDSAAAAGKLTSAKEKQNSLNGAYNFLNSAGGGLNPDIKVEWTTEKGEKKTLTRTQLKDEIVSLHRDVKARRKAAAMSRIEAIKQKAKPGQPVPTEAQIDDQLFRNDIRFYLQNPDLDNPEWKHLFSNLNIDGTSQVLTAGRDAPDRVNTAVEQYMKIRAMAPGLADKHIGDPETKDYLDTYYLSRRDGESHQEALLTASTFTQRKNSPEGLPKVDGKALATDKVMAALDQRMEGWFGADYQPSSFDVNAIRARARFYIQTGRNPKDAMENAAEWFASKHTAINGHAVYTGHADTPPDLKPMAKVHFENLVKFKGKELGIDDPDRLFLRADGAGGWITMYRPKDGVTRYVADSNGLVSHLTPALIGAYRNEEARKKARELSAQSKGQPKWELGPFKLFGTTNTRLQAKFLRERNNELVQFELAEQRKGRKEGDLLRFDREQKLSDDRFLENQSP